MVGPAGDGGIAAQLIEEAEGEGTPSQNELCEPIAAPPTLAASLGYVCPGAPRRAGEAHWDGFVPPAHIEVWMRYEGTPYRVIVNTGTMQNVVEQVGEDERLVAVLQSSLLRRQIVAAARDQVERAVRGLPELTVRGPTGRHG